MVPVTLGHTSSRLVVVCKVSAITPVKYKQNAVRVQSAVVSQLPNEPSGDRSSAPFGRLWVDPSRDMESEGIHFPSVLANTLNDCCPIRLMPAGMAMKGPDTEFISFGPNQP